MTPMRFGLVLAGLLLFAPPASATVLLDLSLEERIARADTVVVGTVKSQRTFRAGTLILTESTLRVEETLYGAPGKTLVVTTVGGTIGDTTMDVPGEAMLAVGQRLVVIARRDANGRNHLVGMSMGAFTLRGDVAEQVIVVPTLRRHGGLAEPQGQVVTDLTRIRAAVGAAHR